jgi:hypothetical protein
MGQHGLPPRKSRQLSEQIWAFPHVLAQDDKEMGGDIVPPISY